MARKKPNSPQYKSETKREAIRNIATSAFNSIIDNLPSGNFSAFDQIVAEIEPLELNYGEAAEAFRLVEVFLRDFAQSCEFEGESYTAGLHIQHLRAKAKKYFADRIHSDTVGIKVWNILSEMEKHLENDSISPYFRDACEEVRQLCEKKILRLRKRAEIKESLKLYDNQPAAAYELTDREILLANLCPLFAKAMPETQRIVWRMMQKFTRKQWACFTDAAKILSRSTKIERAKRIEEICGLTELRNLFGKTATENDKATVMKALTLLRADFIKADWKE